MLDFPQNGHPRTQNGSRPIRFADFEVDFHLGEIRRSGQRVKIQEQPFKVLQVLLETPGELVSREELQVRIWPQTSFGDFDHAVNVAVGKLRVALEDSAEHPAFIETVPRRGYRFIAKLAEELPVVQPEEPAPHTTHHHIKKGHAHKPARSLAQRKPLLLIGAGILSCTLLIAVGILLGLRFTRTQSPTFQRLTVRRGTVYLARFTPDGHNIVYSASWDGAPTEIFSSSTKFSGAHNLGLPSTQLLAVSPTGEMAVLQSLNLRFMFTSRGILGQVPLSGGSPRQIAENVEWADWSPDGKTLAIVQDLGGKQRIEYPLGHVLYETAGWISHLRISPKGDQIAFLEHAVTRDDRGEVGLVDLQGHKKTLSTGWESSQGLAWTPNGKEIWFSATLAGLERKIYAVDLSGHQRLVYQAPGGVVLQDIASDGRVLLTRNDQRLGMMALGPGATKERELSWMDWSLPVAMSADGNTLLFDEQGEEGGPNYTVAIRDLQGSAPTALGEGMAGDLSPDGKWVSSIVASNQLMLLPTGVGQSRRLERGDIQRYGHGLRWFPDGKQLLFSGNLPGHASQCFLQDINGGKPRPVTPEGITQCRPSPDGTVISGSDVSGNESRLYPLQRGEPRIITGLAAGESFLWTSDPNFLYVYQWKQLPLRIYRLDIHSGQRQLFKEIRPSDSAGLCDLSNLVFSADGKAYAYSYTQTISELYLATGMK